MLVIISLTPRPAGADLYTHGLCSWAAGQPGSNGDPGTYVLYGQGGSGGGGGTGPTVNWASPPIIQPWTSGSIQASGPGFWGQSTGGQGGDGGNGGGLIYGIGGGGGQGGDGGSVTVVNSFQITSSGSCDYTIPPYTVSTAYPGVGIWGVSQGGQGGGGGGGYGADGKGGNGGAGGNGGTVAITNQAGGTVSTSGDNNWGIAAQSLGGNGGNGGSGGGIFGGGGGGSQSGGGGSVSIANSASLSTTGNYSYGIFGQSVGGFGGSGGSGDGVFGYGGNSNNSGDGGTVAITTTGSDVAISTSGQGADAIRAQSVGGGGGSAGSATGLVALGGSGSAAGNGGSVMVNNENCLNAQGEFSYGIYAQSTGGGGGSSNPAVGALAAIGGRDSSGGDGGSVTVVNSGQITSTNSAIYAQSVGGGGGSGATAVGGNVTIGGSSSNGGNAVAVTVQNSNSTLETSDPNASAIYAQSLGGGGGKGGNAVAGSAGLSVAIGQSGGQGGSAGPVTVDVTGSSMQTSGLMSDGINAQSVGGGGGSGGFSVAVDACGVLALSLGGSGGNGGYGGEVTVNYANTTILTTGNYQSHGVFAQSVGGGGGNGGFSIAASGGPVSAAISLGGSAGSGGGAGAVTFTDSSSDILNSTIQTTGELSHGLFLQSVGGGGGHGGFSVSGNATLAGAAVNIGGSGGNGGLGSTVTLQDTGIGAAITTSGSKSCGILAQSVGGGGGDAGFSVAGSLGVEGSAAVSLGGSGGLGGNGGSISANLNRTITTEGDAAAGILLQSVGGGGGNGGFSVAGSMTVTPPSGSGASINAAVSLGGSGGGGGSGDQVSLSTSEGTTVNTAGLGSVGILVQSVGGGGGNGGFSVAGALSLNGTPAGAAAGVSLGGTGGSGGDGSQVTVNLEDSVTTTGHLASGVLAQSLGGGGGNGGFAVTGSVAFGSNDVTGTATVSVGGSGGNGGHGGIVNCTSSGAISTQGWLSTSLLAQSVGGGGGNGGFAVAAGASVIAGSTYQVTVGGGAGGSGGSGGDGGQVILANSGQIATQGWLSTGVLAQSVGGGGGNGGFGVAGVCNFEANSSKGATLSTMVGGTGGSGGDGGQVGLTNSGQVDTQGGLSSGVLAQSVGGGGGNGGFSANLTFNKQTVSASVAVGGSGGSGGQGNSVSVTNTGTITTGGLLSTGVLAQSVGGGGGNAGFGAAGNIDPGSTNNPTLNLNLAIGCNGGSGGDGGQVTVDSYGDAIITTGDLANGITVQSVGGGGGNANFSLSVTGSGNKAISLGSADVPLLHLGSNGGEGGNGNTASLENYSSINTGGIMSDGILVQSVGGGGGNGSMEITGKVSYNSGNATVKLGATGTNGAGGGSGGSVTVNDILGPGQTSKSIVTRGFMADGIQAQSIGAGGGNGGDSYSLAISNNNGWVPSYSLALGAGGGAGGQAGDVAVTSASSISTQGFMAYGLLAQSIGGGGGNGGRAVSADISGQTSNLQITGVSAALGGSGGNGGLAGKVSVSASGTAIQTDNACAAGILAQSVGGGGGSGGASISVDAALSRNNSGVSASVSLGGNGGSGGQADTVTVTSSSVIDTFGRNALMPGMPSTWSPGILAQSVGGGGGAGGFSIAGDFNAALGQTDFSADCTFSLGGNGGDGNVSGAVSVTSTGASITTGCDISPGLLAQSVAGGGGHGGFSIAGDLNGANTKNFNGEMSISVGGSGGTGGAAGNVTVSNAGSISTGCFDSQGNVWGYKSPGLAAQSIGGGGGDGGFSVAGDVNFQGNQPISGRIGGAIDASGDGGSGGQAGSVSLTHNGAMITTKGDLSAAILGLSLGGGGGDGGFAVAGNLMITPSSDSGPNSMGASFSIGGSGGSGGAGGDVSVTVTNPGNTLATQGYLSPGIQAQSIGGGGGNGGFSVAGGLNANGPGQLSLAIGGEGGFGNSAGKVTVADQGASISTAGAVAPGIEAQSIGGGGGNGNFGIGYGLGVYSIASAVTTSITSLLGGIGGNGGNGGNAGQVDVTSSSRIATQGEDSPGILAQSIGAGGGHGGFSLRGQLTQGMPGILNVGAGNGASGSGNNVTVNAGQAGITTSGERAAGILAQSIGGGGGVSWISIDSDGFQAGNGTLAIGGQNSSGDGGTVLVQNQTGKPSLATAISTTGVNAIGILAQSIGGGGGVGSNDALGKSSVTISGSNSASGNGGQASVVSQGDITTSAIGAYGIMAQSIGGGGGLALNYIPGSLNSLGTTMPAGDGTNQGDGGAINVTTTGTLSTSGGAAIGLVAQSLGGGGGLDVSGGNAGSAGGQGSGGAISIDNTGTISTSGTYAHGIFAQSAGGQGSGGSVTISNEGAIAVTGTLAHAIVAVSSGQSGAGAITITNGGTGSIVGAADGTTPIYLVGGNQNIIYNYGSITTTGEPVQGSYRNFYQNGTLKAGNLSVDNEFTNTGTLTAGSIVVNPGGTFTQSGGTLAVSSDSAPGGGTLNINSGTLQASSGSHTLGNNLKVSGDFALGGTNNFTLFGDVDLGGATRTITVTNSGDTNLSGIISNGGLSIDNTGGSSLTLSGANTYTGTTTLNSGTLLAGNNKAFNPTDGAKLIIKGGTIGASAPVITINIPLVIDSNFNMGGPDGTNLKLTSDMNLSGFLLTHSGAGNDILSGDLTCSAVAGTGICVTGGTLNLTGNNVKYVATSTVTGGTLNLQGVANYTGDTMVSGGILNMNSAVNYGRAGGTNTITGGILNMSGTGAAYLNDSTVTGGVLNLSAGTYNGKLDLGANGTFNYTGGSFAPTGGANMTAGAGSTTTIASGLHLNLGAGNTMTHNGAFNISSGSRLTGTVIGNAGSTTTVNGMVTGNVSNNGLLMGSGTITGNLTSNGTVNPGNSPGTLTVGTYTPGATNVQVVEMASASNYDKIVITAAGGATLNGTLSPRLLNGYLPSTNTLFHVVEATGGGTVTGTFAGIDNTRVGASRTLFWQALHTATTADLKAVGNYTPPDLALSRNERSVGNTLNSLAPNTTGGDALTVLDAINALTTDTGVRAAYKEISPAKYAALGTMSMPITHLQFQFLQNRLARERWEREVGSEMVHSGWGGFMQGFNFGFKSETRSMLAASNMTISDAGQKLIRTDIERRWGVYLEPMANWGTLDATANTVGFRYKNFGFTLGAEYWVLDSLLVGVNTGYSKTLGSSGGSGGDLNANVIPVNAYGAFFHQGFYANAAVGYTYSGYDMTRNVVFGTINRTAQASTSGNQFQLGAETGYDAKIGNAVVGPVVSLQYATQTTGAFTESNAGALALKVGSQSADSVQTGLGARASYKVKLGGVAVKPQLQMTWQHEFSGNPRGLNASLAAGGSTINFQTDRIGQDFALISLDVPAKITKNLVANAGYTAEVGRDKSTNMGVNIGLKLKW